MSSFGAGVVWSVPDHSDRIRRAETDQPEMREVFPMHVHCTLAEVCGFVAHALCLCKSAHLIARGLEEGEAFKGCPRRLDRRLNSEFLSESQAAEG